VAQIYTIEAYSPSTGQTVRWFDLTNIVNEQMTKDQAELAASRFAQLQNSNFYMHVCDWQPLVKQQQVGIETVDGYLYSR